MQPLLYLLFFVFTLVCAKPYVITVDDPVCGYDACHDIDNEKINVHLIPHSHDDVGWISTVEQYYYNQVQYIISSVVTALLKNPDRRFIQVETAFFYMWWKEQSDLVKSQVQQLINEGRLEMVNAAWSMNDEAAVHYQATIDQYTIGLKFIEENLGKCARPRAGWQIDPFGHSREQASLLSQIGIDSVFFARVDVRDKEARKNSKNLDMIWTGSANLGSDSNIFASVLYNHYSAPAGFCFDIMCSDDPIITDEESPEYNFEQRVNDFVRIIEDQYEHYQTNHLLVTLGDDFMWQAAPNSYMNVDKLIEGFKKFNPKVKNKEINIIYSTPSCYTKAVHDYVEAKNITLDVKTDDFFPYGDSMTTNVVGYFTSRPTSKRLERVANNLLQVSKQISAIGGIDFDSNIILGQALGIMQHHDAITGTEKTHVEKDYHKILVKGMEAEIPNIDSALTSILSSSKNLNLKTCLLSNVSICSESDKDEFNVLIYNPLARTTSHYIQIPVNDGTWKVSDPSGNEVENTLTEPIRNFDYITNDTGYKVLDKILFFRAEDLPPLGFKVYNLQKVSDKTKIKEKVKDTVSRMGFTDRYVNFNVDSGLLESITINGVTLDVTQKMLYYISGGSNTYIFKPDNDQREAVEIGDVTNTVLTNDGNLIREVKQEWKDWATQIIRIYKDEDFIEFDWLIGPVDQTDGRGKEVITRYTTQLSDVNEEFYTDSNAREMIYRKKNYRPTYEYTDEEPQSGNYYPVSSRILLKNADTEFAVITDRCEGGSSLQSGEVELMLTRNLLQDDSVGEHLNEYEYGELLLARGSHYVTLGNSKEGNGGRTMAVVERDIAQRKLLQPWVFYTTEDINVKEQSFLNKELPGNVHLLTLENWNVEENTILIRLEHFLEKDDDPDLSKDVTVDVSDLFKTLKITSMKEYMLAANTPIEENFRLKWSQIPETEDESSPLSIKNRLARDESDLSITLAPMQIRTFIATVERNN